MAAEFVLTFSAQRILLKVYSLAAEELAVAWGFKAELSKLGESLNILQDFLHGVADQRPQYQGKAVEKWVKSLEDVAHDADDVLDEFNYELLRCKIELQNHMKRKILNFLSTSNPLVFRLKMGHKIKKINDSLVKLKNEAAFINFVARRDLRPGIEQAHRDQTDSFLEPDEEVVGREDIIRNIVEMLVDNSNNEKKNLSVMAIVGMPGLGKTTLAKSVYNTPLISTTFDKKIWVCVSNTFEVDVILNQMVESLAPSKAGLKSQDALIKVLIEELTGKRFVLVLDDVWNEDSGKWESLMSCLSKLGSNKGNNIIITTRSADVASIAETLTRPQLINLTDDECWSILKKRAWNDNYSLDKNREIIGRAIAEKCRGIPLVAKVLGGVMRSKASKAEWLSIQNSEIWAQSIEMDKIMSILKLSFDNLKSPSLKQCFAYCSMLNKDFAIERDELVLLWMAEGLLQQPLIDQIHTEMEDIGNEYFNILLNNSLLQKVPSNGWRGDNMYTMHDLVHDLAQQVSSFDTLTQNSEDASGVRHVVHASASTLEKISKGGGRLHSLFSKEQKIAKINFCKFKSLRVLSLSKGYIQELPTSIGKLKHLRYLDVSGTRIKALPKSIGKLYNLQTLKVQNNQLFDELPREMQNLKNLRHLYVDYKVKIPAGMLKGLTNLQTPPYFRVGEEMGSGIEELGGLNKLKGRLSISNLENVRDEEDAKKAKLQEKINIVQLSLSFNRTMESTSTMNDEKVLEALKPHSKLEGLSIDGFMGDRFPSWMMKVPLPLLNLKQLILDYCDQCEELPVLGHLPFLGDLVITGMTKLKCMGSEMYGYDCVYEEARREKKKSVVLFPALKTLTIKYCWELSEWKEAPTTTTSTEVVTVFPCLEEFTIKDCPKIGFIPISHDTISLRLLTIESCKGLSSIGELDHCISLQRLVVSYCESLVSIPISQGLPCLRELKIVECKGLSSIGQLDHCTSLQVLDISACESLVSIPISQGLPCLRELKIKNCNGLSSIGQLDHCTSLQVLSISFCESLVSIPISQGLQCLRELEIFVCKGLSSIGQLDHCTSLQVLDISACESLVSIPISQGLPCLRELKIRKCNGLSSTVQLDHCTSLQVLEILACESLVLIPISQGLPRLRELRIWNFKGLSSIGQLDHCTSLQVLDILACESLVSIPISQGLPHLCELKIKNCNGLSSIGQLDHCTSLQVLNISYCESLVSIPISQRLPCLRELKIVSCKGLSSIGQLDHCTSLQWLSISICESLVSIPISQGLPCLRELRIYYCKGLSSIGQLDHCTSLHVLKISDCESLVSIPISQGLPCLRELKIEECKGLSSIGQLDHCTSLQVLDISSCESLVSIPISQGLPCLHKLRIWNCKGLSSIGQLDHCTSLQVLTIYGSESSTIPISLEEYTFLRWLLIGNCDKLKSVPTGLGNLTRLKDLLLGPFWEELDSFPEFQVPPQLVRLNLIGWDKLKSLIPQQLQQLTLLTKLTIQFFNEVETLPEWLGNLASLGDLKIKDCKNLKHLPSLEAMQRLTKLQTLTIYGCPLLEERCKRDSGEEWPKISHIPLIRLRRTYYQH